MISLLECVDVIFNVWWNDMISFFYVVYIPMVIGPPSYEGPIKSPFVCLSVCPSVSLEFFLGIAH